MNGEPSPVRRTVLFVCVVLVLAGVGVYLTLPGLRGQSEPAGNPAPQPTQAQEIPGGSQSSPTASTPAASPSLSPSPSPAPLELLPLTEEEVGEAARVARQFVRLFTSYRYDQDPKQYQERLSALATGPIAGELSQRSTALNARQEIVRNEVVATSTVSMDSIRLLSEGSVVFVVVAEQTIASTKGTGEETKRYAVTAVRAGANWKVSNMTLASLGD